MFEDRTKTAKRTELSDLGEFGLIDHLTKGFIPNQPSTIKGIGDDAAVLAAGDLRKLVTTDLLCEGIHFDLTYVPLRHLGYKAVTINLSDIYAMNGTPKQITVSIAISNRFSLEAIEEFYAGVALACKRYNVDLVGGDTSSSTSGLFISITAIGEIDDKHIAYRNGAKEGDLIFTSGDLGGAYMGLLLLEREKQVFKADPNMQPELEGHDYLLERQLKPEPRQDIIEILRELEITPTSMIDISDGLASELHHICIASEVGCTIYEEKIPIDQATYDLAREFTIDPTTAAFNGGEDYELLFTISPKDYDKLKNVPTCCSIGHITDKNASLQLISKDGKSFPITAQGFDHLKKEA